MNEQQEFPQGVTKKEYFAAMALQGILANPDPESLGIGHGYTASSLAVKEANRLIESLNYTN